MSVKHGAGYERRQRQLCGVRQHTVHEGSYPLKTRVSAQKRAARAGEKLIMLLLSPPGPLLIFFLYKCCRESHEF